MRPHMILGLCLVTVALAGCSAPDAAPDDDELDLGQKPRASAETGVIIGVVVDEGVAPVAGATVSLQGLDVVTTTNDQGAFSFGDLEPGSHFVRVEKPGYFTAQQSVEVVAGVERPDIVRFLLETDSDAKPYVMGFVFEGFIECSVTLVAVGWALCSELETGNDHFSVEHGLDRAPSFAQSEMVWQSTQELGSSLDIMYSWDCGGAFYCDHTASGGSPLILRANETVLAEAGFDQGTPLLVRVFNSDVPETRPPCVDLVLTDACLWGVGATLNQEFTIYTHIFYNMRPGEGWQFSQDGDPVVPA